MCILYINLYIIYLPLSISHIFIKHVRTNQTPPSPPALRMNIHGYPQLYWHCSVTAWSQRRGRSRPQKWERGPGASLEQGRGNEANMDKRPRWIQRWERGAEIEHRYGKHWKQIHLARLSLGMKGLRDSAEGPAETGEAVSVEGWTTLVRCFSWWLSAASLNRETCYLRLRLETRRLRLGQGR